MKKTLAIVLTCAFAFGGLAACGDPCEKAVTKMIDCMGKDNKELKEKMSKEKDKAIEACKKSDDDKKKAKECAKESDCKKFIECMGKK